MTRRFMIWTLTTTLPTTLPAAALTCRGRLHNAPCDLGNPVSALGAGGSFPRGQHFDAAYMRDIGAQQCAHGKYRRC